MTQDPAPAEPSFTKEIVRVFDFSRSSLLEMFTDPKKAVKWFGSPEGAVKVHFEWDMRPGGTFRILDQMEGQTAETIWTVQELVLPERIVLRSATTPPGGGAPWEAQQTVMLEELGPRRTRLTVRVRVLTPGSFSGGILALLEGFEGGWGETLEMLRRDLLGGGGPSLAKSGKAA